MTPLATFAVVDLAGSQACLERTEVASSAAWNPTIPASELSAWQLDALSSLFTVAKLPEGWDGEGSPSPRHVVPLALQLICAADLDDLPTPQFVPVSGGGLQIEWGADDRELELEILPTGVVEFLQVKDGRPLREGTFFSGDSARTRALLSWLATG